MPGDQLTIKEVVIITGLSPAKVHKMIDRGDIPAEKFGWQWLIKRKDIEPFIKK